MQCDRVHPSNTCGVIEFTLLTQYMQCEWEECCGQWCEEVWNHAKHTIRTCLWPLEAENDLESCGLPANDYSHMYRYACTHKHTHMNTLSHTCTHTTQIVVSQCSLRFLRWTSHQTASEHASIILTSSIMCLRFCSWTVAAGGRIYPSPESSRTLACSESHCFFCVA